jgi:hypothetical protein
VSFFSFLTTFTSSSPLFSVFVSSQISSVSLSEEDSITGAELSLSTKLHFNQSGISVSSSSSGTNFVNSSNSSFVSNFGSRLVSCLVSSTCTSNSSFGNVWLSNENSSGKFHSNHSETSQVSLDSEVSICSCCCDSQDKFEVSS